MSHPNQQVKEATEAEYELPNQEDVVLAVMNTRKQSVQETLEALACRGYYIVRRKK